MKYVLACLALLVALGSPASAQPARTPAELHDICVAALNADPKLAEQIVGAVNEDTKQQHLAAGEHVAKNERHVILAYGAMWLVSAGFVLFLWRRQQALREELARLRRDLEAAAAAP